MYYETYRQGVKSILGGLNAAGAATVPDALSARALAQLAAWYAEQSRCFEAMARCQLQREDDDRRYRASQKTRAEKLRQCGDGIAAGLDNGVSIEAAAAEMAEKTGLSIEDAKLGFELVNRSRLQRQRLEADRKIMALWRAGLPDGQIAARLGLCRKTIVRRRKAVLSELEEK